MGPSANLADSDNVAKQSSASRPKAIVSQRPERMRGWRVAGAVLAGLASTGAWAESKAPLDVREAHSAKTAEPSAMATETNAPPAVTIENAWIRAPVAGQTVTAGYCDIRNGGGEPVTIVGFAGPMRTELHETREQNGMVRMRPVRALTVAPWSTTRLAPGGKHLMLFGAGELAGAGPEAQVELRAELATGETLPARFRVRTPGAGGGVESDGRRHTEDKS